MVLAKANSKAKSKIHKQGDGVSGLCGVSGGGGMARAPNHNYQQTFTKTQATIKKGKVEGQMAPRELLNRNKSKTKQNKTNGADNRAKPSFVSSCLLFILILCFIKFLRFLLFFI